MDDQVWLYRRMRATLSSERPQRRRGLRRCFKLGFVLTLLCVCVATSAGAAPFIHFDRSVPVAIESPPDVPPEHQLRFAHLSIEDGLSHGMVLRIVQDDLGFMWFGTADGLNRYDAHTFKVYKSNPDDPGSLRSDSIWALYVDREGTLWVGTEGGGLSYLDRDADSFVHYLHDPDDAHSLSNDGVTVIYEDQAGALWVGTAAGGLNRFDRAASRADSRAASRAAGQAGSQGTGHFTHYRHDPDDPHSLSSDGVISLFEDSEGVLWVGTSEGLNRLDRETGACTRYQNDPADAHSLSHNSVWVIHEDRNGALWVGTAGGGLSRFNRAASRETEEFTHYQFDPDDEQSLSNDIVFALHELPGGDFLVGTYGGGLNRFNPQTGRSIRYERDDLDPYSLSSNHIRSIYAGRSGVLWIGTEGGGINRNDPPYKRFLHYRAVPGDPNSLSDHFVTALHEGREGALWIGTLDGGLNRLDRETGELTYYRYDPSDPHSLSDDNVTGVYEDHLGVLWAATGNGGLNRLDRVSGRFTHYRRDSTDPDSLSTDALYTVYEDRDNRLWIGTNGGGLALFDRETERFTHYRHDPGDPHSLSHDRVNAIYEDRAGYLWIGTSGGGVNRFDQETGQFTRYQADVDDPDSLSNDVVFAIHEDQAGNLWVGTAGGLNRFDPVTETFVHYREIGDLPSNLIAGILEDENGNLWLSTGQGLARLDPRTETIRNYDAGDGLQSAQFQPGAYDKGRDGIMFFGGVNGFNAFHPEEIKDNPFKPPVVLTALYQGGDEAPLDQAVETLDAITLRWPNNFFEFEFAALNYVRPDKNRYAYILEGFDRDWNQTGNRHFGRYTNLPGGTYTLRLRGANNDGVWNEEATTLRVTVVPPIWNTTWFRVSAALLALGGVGAFFAVRIRTIEAQRWQLKMLVAERTQELRLEITERQQAEQAVRARNKDLARLNWLGQQLTSTLDLDHIVHQLLEAAIETVDAEGASLWLWDESQPEQPDILACRAVMHQGEEPEMIDMHVSADQGIIGWTARTGESVIVNDVASDPRFFPDVDEQVEFHTHSVLAVPLRAQDAVIGVMEVVNKQSSAFDDDDRAMVETLAASAAIATDNAQLMDALWKRTVDLEARNEELDAFAHTVAHDLKNPLAKVVGFADLLTLDHENMSGEACDDILKRIVRSGRKMGDIIDELLLLCSVRQLGEIEICPLNMACIVDEALEQLTKMIDEYQAEISRPETWPVALGHPQWVEAVWVNYISNALKYGGQPPQVTLGADLIPPSEETEKEMVRFWVRDNGPGLSPEDQACLFTPFTRLDQTRAKGHGLGLSIARRIVEKLGGQVGVESEPGQGSKFYFTLPLGSLL
jgi:ligand-binding sensor domain-containing protein/signal transduction histidine kinase